MWVTGSTNHKSSNIVNHNKSEQCTVQMAHMSVNSAKAQHAENLLWANCTHRQNQRPMEEYMPREAQKDPGTITSDDGEDPEQESTLND